jgi:protein SCO1/2
MSVNASSQPFKASRSSIRGIAFIAGLLAIGLVSLIKTAGRAGLPPGGDFTLQSADGPLALHDLHGKVVLLFFGFIHCPEVCPTALSYEAAAIRILSPDEQARVAGLMISVDPERDTLPALKDYGYTFHPRISGVTGSATTLQEITRRYGVIYTRRAADPSGNYSVDHTADIYVIAPDGRLLARMPYGTSPEDLANEIRLALR